MAQYFHVLSQDNPNVQYVISPEAVQPTLQGQQIVLSTDQLMVIENQARPVMVEQGGTAFQNAQYIIQENIPTYANVRTQVPQQHQVYYTTTTTDGDQTESHDKQASPPIVLNQLQQQVRVQTQKAAASRPQLNRLPATLPASIKYTLMQQRAQTQAAPRPQLAMQQVRQTPPAVSQTPNNITPQQKLVINNRGANSSANATPQRMNDVSLRYSHSEELTPHNKNPNGTEAVALPDGTVVPLSSYKAMLAKKRKNQTATTSPTPETQCGVQSRQSYSQTPPESSVFQTQAEKFVAQQQLKMVQEQKKSHARRDQREQLSQQQKLQQQQLRQQKLQEQFKQQQQLLQQQQQQQDSYSQPHFVIKPPSIHDVPPTYTLPPYVVSSQIQHIIETTPINEEFPDSIRMLVLLESGEQRLITFTLPKEQCTIQEILEQVGVPFQADTRIECHQTCYPGINYLVVVGMQPELMRMAAAASQAAANDPSNPPSPELLGDEIEGRYVTGLVAICTHCGYSSENLNQCLRCKHRLPSEVRTTPLAEGAEPDKPGQITITLKNHPPGETKMVADGAGKKTKAEPEMDVLTLSSDDEEESLLPNNLSETDKLIKRLSESAVTLRAIRKEPTANELQQNLDKRYVTAVKGGGRDDNGSLVTAIKCRTIRIGSYKYSPLFDFIIKPSEAVLKVPLIHNTSETKTIVIERKHIVKVLVNFQKALPVLFYYVAPSLGEIIRSELGMELGMEAYFDPLSDEEAYKRITILPEVITEDVKEGLKEIYGKPPDVLMDELTTKEANDILVKTCPKEISKFVESTRSFSPEVKQLLIFPPGKGGLPINTEDYMCLAQDQFLNDVIIDFYLKYLVLNLPLERQAKIHVFSTFFYKRLTTKPVKATKRSHPAELDPNLTAAQRRHARVLKWTKNVNLFEKDFIIVPINENCHWYLAIICFPYLDGAYTMEGKRTQIEHRRKAPKIPLLATLNNARLYKEKEKPIVCDDEDASDKDEAEGDDSELESDSEDSEAAAMIADKQNLPIKQPCILIFDSLAGASRARVVATLRDYLTCEYKAKCGAAKTFDKNTIKGNCPKVPQQMNFTDCGLYLLQYVEHFLTQPIDNYRVPIKHLKNWFDEFTVTRKREDIAVLIKDLMEEYNMDTSCVPELTLPTMDGKLIDNFEDEDETLVEYEEDEESHVEEDASSECLNSSMENHADAEPHSDLDVTGKSEVSLILKPCAGTRSQNFLEETVVNECELKPNVSELQTSNRQKTLSYLKSKRINRHKISDEVVEAKKFKTS